MNLWQSIKSFVVPNRKSYLEPYTSYSLWDRFTDQLRRGTTRTTASNSAEAYAYHELVFSCINKIADVMNDAEIIVERQNSDGIYEEVPGHPLTNLLNMPNSMDLGEDFRRKMVISEQTAGITYILIDRSRAGIPAELVIVNPFRIKVVPNYDQTDVAYYEYEKLNGKVIRIEKENLFIRKRADLFNQNMGISPVMVALKAINSDMGLTDYVDALFENDGTPTGVLKILQRTVSETEKKKIQEAWTKKYGRGGSHQKGVAVLDANADYQQIGSKLTDLDSEAISSRFESRICSVFGVPPLLVGAFVGLRWVNQRASAKEALQDFWENKISPELKVLRKWLNWFVLSEFESIEDIRSGKVRVSWDVTNAAFLQEDLDRAHGRARKNFLADGITKNEFRELIGFKATPEGDVFRSDYLGQSMEAIELEPEKEPKSIEPVKKKIELKYWRELSDIEKTIDIKRIEDDLESAGEKLTALFLEIREDLIKQASDQAHSPNAEIDLVISPKYQKQAEKLLNDIYRVGRTQVLDELNSQKSRELKERDFDVLDFLQLIFSRITTEIVVRAINIITLLYAEDQFDSDEMELRLRDESQKVFEQLARYSANLTIQAGREKELEENEIALFEYSAILDKNTCSNCREWDGEQASTLDALPKCPNKDCDGKWNCRCFIVGIGPESD